MLAEALFGLPIAVWQRCPNTESKQECSSATSKQEEYDVTDSGPKVTAEENNTMSGSKGKSTSREWKKAVKEGRGTATEFKTVKGEAQADVSKAVNQDTGGSGINRGKAHRATEQNEMPKGAKRQGEGSGFIRNMLGSWMKIHQLIHLYRMIKENITIVPLVVAFYFLLFLSFCARVPVVGTVLLSCGIMFFFGHSVVVDCQYEITIVCESVPSLMFIYFCYETSICKLSSTVVAFSKNIAK